MADGKLCELDEDDDESELEDDELLRDELELEEATNHLALLVCSNTIYDLYPPVA